MDVVKKINELRKNMGWSVYQLAKEAGITQSTIANMFYRNSTPSIETLEQICSAFNLTLYEFFNEQHETYNNEELSLIHKYRKLEKKEKNYIQNIINIMSK